MRILSFQRQLIFIVLFSMIAILTFSCRKHWFKTDPLTLPMQDYFGDQMRVDGYYYEQDFSSTYFLFRNGVILAGGGFRDGDFDAYESDWLDGSALEVALKYQFSWGLFIVEGDNIKFERWYPGNPPLLAYVREGTILNDTTFHITESYRFSSSGKKREIKERDEYYHFRAYSPKPDSTNPFVP